MGDLEIKKEGFRIKEKDFRVLEKLQELFQIDIPIISEVGSDQFGAVLWFKRIIGLSLNKIGASEFPIEILDLEKLRFLYVEFNEIQELPPALENFESLEVLSLRGNPLIELNSVPPNLVKLDAGQTKIAEISIERKTKLKELKLYKSQLTTLDLKTSLETLDISKNRLVLDQVQYPEGLKHVNASFNRIGDRFPSFPNTIERLELVHVGFEGTFDFSAISSLANLKKLSLASNHIEDIIFPVSGLNLVELDLSNNRISNIPESLNTLLNLEELYLGGNRIVSLPHEPITIPNLRRLSLEKNQIQNLPSWMFGVHYEIDLRKNPVVL